MSSIHRRVMTVLLFAAIIVSGSKVEAQSTPPAQIDRTTPHAQNGLTLLAVTRGDAQGQYLFPVPQNLSFLTGPRSNGPPGGIGLWVRGIKPPAPMVQKGKRPVYQMPFYQNPTASATALNGDFIPVQIEPVSSFNENPQGGQPAPLFLITLPGGYPGGYPAIDLSMNSSPGHSARWRLIRLTSSYHAIAPPVAVHSSFAGSGVKLTVQAWRDNAQGTPRPGFGQYQGGMQGVHYAMTAQIPAGSKWIVRIFKKQLEWEAVRPGELEALMSHYGPRGRQFPRQALWGTEFGQASNFPSQDIVPTPYGKHNHYLPLSGELVQMATATENLTFHNLNIRQSAPPPQYGSIRNSYKPPPAYEISTPPQKQVTPSGISVSILPLSALGSQYSQFGYYGSPDTIRMLLRFGQAVPGSAPFQQTPLILPKSPLYKRYHKPVTYLLQTPKPYTLEPSFGGFPSQGQGAPTQMMVSLRLPPVQPIRKTLRTGQVIYRMPPNVVPKHLNSLTLNVVQSAELRSIPISFVVAIGNQAPGQAVGRPFGR
ncbi:MAG: hypothetical protein ACRYFS_11120 [Janthinobacterium lividum]